MTEVWIIAVPQRQTYGHGDSGYLWKLPTVGPYDGGQFRPAFASEALATAYLGTLVYAGEMTVVRIPVWTSPWGPGK
jgi:hypothetical protein